MICESLDLDIFINYHQNALTNSTKQYKWFESRSIFFGQPPPPTAALFVEQIECKPTVYQMPLDKFHLPFWFVCWRRVVEKKPGDEDRFSGASIICSAQFSLFLPLVAAHESVDLNDSPNILIGIDYRIVGANGISTPFSCHRHYRILWLLIIRQLSFVVGSKPLLLARRGVLTTSSYHL